MPEESARNRTVEPTAYDAIIIGAGFSGLNALDFLSKALKVRLLEAGSGVGGTWYWNRYPGARCDVESIDYSYSYNGEIYNEWEWTKRYPEQAELERYVNWVADRLDLRPYIQCDARVSAATFEEDAARWTVETEAGETFTCRFLIAATGFLSAPNLPPFPGLDSFRGEWYQTSLWPKEAVDFDGKRVVVVGTGSSGIQAIPVIADQARHLTVLQRTPNFSIPTGQHHLDPAVLEERRLTLGEWRERGREWRTGFPSGVATGKSVLDFSPEEARRLLDEAWGTADTVKFMSIFTDVITSMEANEVVADFAREKIREVVEDPETAELLCSQGYPFGTKRLCVDTNYFQTYNRDNVSLISIKDNPIAKITESGIELTDGRLVEADVIVFATGFDAVTGALSRITVTGRDGKTLGEAWKQGPLNFLGMQVAGFPNLFTMQGPGCPLNNNFFRGAEFEAGWIRDCISYLEETGARTIEAKEESQDEWVATMAGFVDGTLLPLANSWWRGVNIPGKPHVFMSYIGGWPNYEASCREAAERGYAGFVIDGAERGASGALS